MSKVGDVARFALEVSGNKVEAQELTTSEVRRVGQQMDRISKAAATKGAKKNLSGFEQRVMADGLMRNRKTRRAVKALVRRAKP